LASGASRFDVAWGFSASLERRGSDIAGNYERYLGRIASAAEVAWWINQLQHGMSRQHAVAAFVASVESCSRHGGFMQGWLNGAYQSVLQRNPDANGFMYWDGLIQTNLAGT
jgi:hypothetical protein